VNVDYSQEGPVVAGRLTLAQIEELVAKPMDTKPDKKYFIALSISLTALSIGAICLGLTFFYGVGLWGNNQPVGWAVDIVNFVFWVGIGQLACYTWAILALTFYIRPIIGQKSWRFLHYGSFGMYLLGIFHGLFSGTDTSAGWAQTYYWISAGSLLFLLMYRILAVVIDGLFPQTRKPVQVHTPRPTQG